MTVSGQDNYQKGRLFLQTKSSSPAKFSSGFTFSKETIIGNQIILESNDPKCFVILQTSRKDTIVAAYSTSNLFTKHNDSIVPGASVLIKSIGNTPVRRLMKTGRTNQTPVSPLLNTTWNQDDWYNRYCPFNIKCPAGENTYVGCIAVAMGQIIRYYGKWNDFTINTSYTYRDVNLSAYSTGYEWAEMINTPVSYDMEICQFLYDIGVLVKMNYGHQASSQGTGRARIGFNELGYENANIAQRYQFTEEEWLEIVYSSLEQNAPIFVAGGSHAFVCDGKDEDGLIHFNLGWGGIGDGYYHHSCVGDKFCISEAIFDLMPENEFEPPHSLRIENIYFDKTICWSPPYQWGNPSSYRVYYSDDNYFTHQDTCIRVEDLIPGTLSVKVSAIYPDGESIWIGPVHVFNPGENIMISDPAIQDAVINVIDTEDILLESFSNSEGELANIKTLSIEAPISSIQYFDKMPNLQDLSLNAKGLNKEDFSFLDKLNKLQSLKLYNIDLTEFPDLEQCSKLGKLKLDSCKIENLNFISGLKNLVVLEISDCELDNSSLPDGLESLEQLVIRNVSSTSPLKIIPSPNLRKLEISGAGLKEFNPDFINDRLTCLNLENNELTTMSFMVKFPNLKSIYLSGNQISSFSIHSEHPNLLHIDLSRNVINDVAMSFDFPSLISLDLSQNNFLEFPGIFKNLPNLSYLDLSNNLITSLPSMALPYLRELKLSFNKMNHLKGIELFEALKRLELNGNIISDFSPLILSYNYMALNYLDIRQNPVSKESFLEVIPYLEENIGQFLLPSTYEGRSPCYPTPVSPSKVSNRDMIFSWQCENQDNNTRYDFLLGIGDSTRVISKGLNTPQLNVRLIDGQKYHWQVISHFADTSFYSGLYDIRTTEDVELPYSEDFETYTNGEGITNSSSNWRLTNGNSDEYMDANISVKNSSGGFGKSLHIQSSTNIAIDLDHLDVITMIVAYDQFVQGGKTAHVRLKNLNGLQVDMYSNSHQSYLSINGSVIEEFDVMPNQWNHFRISIQGTNERLAIRCNDQTILSKKWFFKNSRAQIEGIIFSKDQPGGGIQLLNFESYIDNFLIYDANNRTGVDDIQIQDSEIGLFPNPADQYISINGLPVDQRSLSIDILDTWGRTIQQKQLDGARKEYKINVDHLPPGLYFYRLNNSLETLKSGKLLISR